MRSHQTSGDRFQFQPLEGRRMLSVSSGLDDLLADEPGGARPAAPAAFGVAAARAAPHQVPFPGTLSATVPRGPSPVDPNKVRVVLTGSGHAAHLGRFTFTAPHDVDTVTRVATGAYTFTAANGDTLTATFTGAAAPTSTPGVLLITETATITGGTGRFAGATGNFVVERLYDPAAGTTSGSFDGVVSSPGSGKA
jgi:hypothetical protein